MFAGSCKEAIPQGLVDKSSPKWSNVDNSIFISPWCNNNHLQQQQQQQQSEQSSTTPVLSCVDKTPTKTSSIHPFARRTKSRYCVEQKKLFSSTSGIIWKKFNRFLEISKIYFISAYSSKVKSINVALK